MRSMLLTALLFLAGATSSAETAVGASEPELPQAAGVGNMLGIRLPEGFEPTRDVSTQVYVLQPVCALAFERFDFSQAEGAPEEVMEEVLALLVDAGYRIHFVFDQFIDDYGIVLATVFGPSDDAYNLLFDYEKRLFHPVGPCRTRTIDDLPGGPR